MSRKSEKIETPHDPVTGEIPAYHREISQQDLRLDALGREIVDPRSMAPPVGYVRQPTMVDIVRQQIRSAHLAAEAEAAGLETFEEADDFEVDDDFDPSSPYEEIFDPIPPQPRFLNAVEELGPQGRSRRKPATVPAEPADGEPPPDGPRPPAKKAAAPKAPPPVDNPTE